MTLRVVGPFSAWAVASCHYSSDKQQWGKDRFLSLAFSYICLFVFYDKSLPKLNVLHSFLKHHLAVVHKTIFTYWRLVQNQMYGGVCVSIWYESP